MSDHVHMLLAISLEYALLAVGGFMKGKSAIHPARTYGERRQNFCRPAFLGARLFCVNRRSDEEVIRAYIRNREKEDQCLGQLQLCNDLPPLRWSSAQPGD